MEQWLIYGIIRTILIVFLILAQKYETSCKGNVWPIAVHLISGIIIILYAIFNEKLSNFKNANYKLLIISGIIVSFLIIITHTIIKKAPNPAYLRVFSTIEMILILLLSAFIFKEKITIKMIIGFFFIIVGVLILSIL